MSTATIDYDALAAQHGGTPAIDYDALAAQHGGTASSSEPSLDLSNKQGQGTYQMSNGGQTAAVPYGQVQRAAQLGYGFADDTTRQRFNKDAAADPNRPQTMGISGLTPEQSQARTAAIEQSASLPMQVVGGIAKGGGTVARPVLNAAGLAVGASPSDIDRMLTPQTKTQANTKAATEGAALIAAAPAIAAAPLATGVGLATGAVGAGAAHLAGSAAGISPMGTAVLSDAAGLGGGVAGGEASEAMAPAAERIGARFLPSLVDGPPESLLTRAIKPGKNNVNWNADIQRALPLMKSAESQLGHPVEGVDDAIEAAQIAKKQIWQQYQARLGSAGQAGATIDGNQIADAMMNSIDKRTAVQNPGLVQKVKQIADTYRQPISLGDAEDFLQSANKDLNSYYAKNKVGQNVALNDPEISSTVAEAQALRDSLYSKLDQVSGPGAAQLKQAYGSLSNTEKELYGRQLVAARQNPESLSEQLGTISGAGKIAKGVLTLSPGDVLEGAQNIVVSRALKARNSSDSMIERAFAKTQPAQPFPMPSNPRFAGLLPRGPLQTPPPPDASGAMNVPQPAYNATTRAQRLGLLLPDQAGGKIPLMAPDSGMTGGERVAALMQLLRNRQQMALPARASAIPLPPPS